MYFIMQNSHSLKEAFDLIKIAYLMSNTDTERLSVGGDWNITLQSRREALHGNPPPPETNS